MKKALALFLTLVTVLSLTALAAVSSFAADGIPKADNAIFVADSGDDNAAGTTPDAPVASLQTAFDKLPNGGVIVIVGVVTITSTNNIMPAHSGVITITSYYDGVDYRSKPYGTEPVTPRLNLCNATKQLDIFGDTVIDYLRMCTEQGGYQRSGVDGFLKELDAVAEAAGVTGSAVLSEEDAKKDDRFFADPEAKGKVSSRESKKRKANALKDFDLEGFAGIKFGMNKSEGAPKLEKPFRLLSEVKKTTYAGNKLTGFTIAAPADAVKAMSDDELRLETCKLVLALEGELDAEFAVTPTKIDCTGKKVSVVVHSNRAAGVLDVQFSKKR